MSTTPGYGETPAGSSPEQPAWLRKGTDGASSDNPYASPPSGGSAAFDGYGNPVTNPGVTQSPGEATYPPASQNPSQGQSPYPGQPQGQPQYQSQPHYQSQSQYQSPPQYPGQGPYQGPQPGAYPPPGSPWAPVDPYAKSRLAAGLLGIFLGTFGVHRFYLGYTRVGVIMLLMTILSFGVLSVVTSIWGLVEGILYLTDKTGKYSRDASGRPLRD